MAQARAKSHMVGSLYNFSEAAGQEIANLIQTNLDPETSCHFNDSNLFAIHVLHNDNESLACLVNSVKGFISQEEEKESDIFEDKKILRKDGTHPSLTLAATIERRMQVNNPNVEVALIEHENIIRKWSPSSESKGLGLKLNLQLLGRIESLCGCRIEQASDSADFLIKADRVRDIERGMSKLERLDKMMVDEMSFPRIHSFYILEGEMSVGLQLIALKNLVDKRSVTTLLPKDSPIKSLRSLCVLVLVKGLNIVQLNLKPATSNQEQGLWNDQGYSWCQAHDMSAGKTSKEPETHVGQWVSEVPDPDMQDDVFRPEFAVKLQRSNDADTVCKALSLTKKVNTRRARTARGNPDTFNKAFGGSQNENDDKKATTQEKLTIFGSHPAKNASTTKGSEAHRQPPSIEPPYMPSRPIPSCLLSKTSAIESQQLIPRSSAWRVVDRSSRSGSLIDTSVPNQPRGQEDQSEFEAILTTDSLQDPTRLKKRDLIHTMNQRKAPTQLLGGGNAALVNSFEETAIHVLALALPRTGRIGFAVDIGRLLINQQCDSSPFKNRSFKTSEFSSVLPKGGTTGFESLFTNMLTARASDAESIANILLSQGRRLFQQQPVSRKVTYVFSCKAKDGDHVVVEFDDTGDFSVQGSEVLMGALDWHFPKRAWDARLRLTSERSLTTDYQKQVDSIVDNLKIDVTGDRQTLELWTKTIDETLRIESITLRRETFHPATIYPDLILHLTECQDLQVRQPSHSESIYCGSIQAPNVMIKASRLWWEAKISSTSATTILKDNVQLELGEIVAWIPSDIIKNGLIRDLFSATQEIVTQIDHVGFFNRGKGSSDSKTTGKPSENSQDMPARLRRVDPAFW